MEEREMGALETGHTSDVLRQVKSALANMDSLKLKELSNQTIHSSCIGQHRGEILIPVIVYALSKIVERRDGLNITNEEWDLFVRKIGAHLDKAIINVESDNYDEYEKALESILKNIETISPDVKDRIKEVLRKAFVNKGSRLYEHGISLERTAGILGITQWELLEYTGQTGISDVRESISFDVKKRAKMALDFFGVTK